MKTVEELERALRRNEAAALEEIRRQYAQINAPLDASLFLVTVLEAMARVGLPWEAARKLVVSERSSR